LVALNYPASAGDGICAQKLTPNDPTIVGARRLCSQQHADPDYSHADRPTRVGWLSVMKVKRPVTSARHEKKGRDRSRPFLKRTDWKDLESYADRADNAGLRNESALRHENARCVGRVATLDIGVHVGNTERQVIPSI